jgi:hypothetical protein
MGLVSHQFSSAMSDDGKTVFFTTQDALVPQDTNGPCTLDVSLEMYPCTDVYEWHEGALSLISPGTSSASNDVELLGTSASGKDVFFVTRQPLVGWDKDKNTDVYDARAGGGFPEPPAQPVCEGEGCREGGTTAPGGQGAGTASFSGPGNPAPKHGKAKKHHRKHRHHNHQAKHRATRKGR